VIGKIVTPNILSVK